MSAQLSLRLVLRKAYSSMLFQYLDKKDLVLPFGAMYLLSAFVLAASFGFVNGELSGSPVRSMSYGFTHMAFILLSRG